jgi:2-keto-4-pentenoate hydratase/2-oxohepta-3-ene-1,7-dioic acid hydratase in catechol pathway
MRFASLIINGTEQPAFQKADGSFVLFETAWSAAGLAPPRSLLSLIETGENAIEAYRAAEALPGLPADTVTFAPPISRPSKIVGVALNNSLLMGLGYRKFETPAFFMKGPNSLIGHGCPILVKTSYGLTHLEAELAAIIGKRCKDVAVDDALDCVFGYTIINDVTSPGLKDADSIHLQIPPGFGGEHGPAWRKLQSEADRDIYLTYHARSKSTDSFGPIGPVVVTPDEVGDPNALGVRSWVDGELVSEDSTANLTFSVEHCISHLSHAMTLEPGDIIHFGTAARSPTGKNIRDMDFSRFGNEVVIEIEKLGRLVNPIQRKEGI